MQDITYRRADSTDIPALVELRAAFLAEVAAADPNDADLLKALTVYFSNSVPTGEFIAYVAEVQNQVVASSGLVFHKHPPSAKNPSGLEAYIMNMYTVPARRGQGIALALLQELVRIARQSTCRRVRLHAFPKAVSLYTRAGFAPVSSEMEIILR